MNVILPSTRLCGCVHTRVHTVFGLENVMCVGELREMLRLVSQQPSVPGCAFWFDRSVLSKCKIPTKLPFHFGMGSDERVEKKELPCMKTRWP